MNEEYISEDGEIIAKFETLQALLHPLHVFKQTEFGEDSEGQLIIYTGLYREETKLYKYLVYIHICDPDHPELIGGFFAQFMADSPEHAREQASDYVRTVDFYSVGEIYLKVEASDE